MLNAEESGGLFRKWWAYGGPEEFIHREYKLIALATPYVHEHVSEKMWPAYLHGGKGITKSLVPPGTKHHRSRDGEDSESDSDASRQSVLDLEDTPPVVKESSANKSRLSRKDKVSMAREAGQPSRNISGGEDIVLGEEESHEAMESYASIGTHSSPVKVNPTPKKGTNVKKSTPGSKTSLLVTAPLGKVRWRP